LALGSADARGRAARTQARGSPVKEAHDDYPWELVFAPHEQLEGDEFFLMPVTVLRGQLVVRVDYGGRLFAPLSPWHFELVDPEGFGNVQCRTTAAFWRIQQTGSNKQRAAWRWIALRRGTDAPEWVAPAVLCELVAGFDAAACIGDLRYSESYRAEPGGGGYSPDEDPLDLNADNWFHRKLTDAQLKERNRSDRRLGSSKRHGQAGEEREEVYRWIRDDMGPLADALLWFHPTQRDIQARFSKELEHEQYDRAVLGRYALWFQPDPKAPKRKYRAEPVDWLVDRDGVVFEQKRRYVEISVSLPDGFLPRLVAVPKGLILKSSARANWQHRLGVRDVWKSWIGPVDERNTVDAKFYDTPFTYYLYLENARPKKKPLKRAELCKLAWAMFREWIRWVRSTERARKKQRPSELDRVLDLYGEQADGESEEQPDLVLGDEDIKQPTAFNWDTPVPRGGKPIMYRWTVPHVPQSEFSKPTVFYRDPPWLQPFPTRCKSYATTLPPLGFKLDDGRPVSTYVKHARVKPDGARAAHIEDEDTWTIDVRMEARPVERDFESTGLDYVEVVTIVVDIGVRYVWLSPPSPPLVPATASRNTKRNRRAAWETFWKSENEFRSLKIKRKRKPRTEPTFKLGRPKKGEQLGARQVAKIKDWMLDYYRTNGGHYIRGTRTKTMKEAQKRFGISAAMAKRFVDDVLKK
jgi:hypothetical protein